MKSKPFNHWFGWARQLNPFHRSLLGFIALTVGFQWLTLEYSSSSSVTVDEFAHVPAGVATWETGTFNAYRENPPLVRSLLALPAWLANAKMDYSSTRAGSGERSEWQVGTDFMHQNAASYLAIYSKARFVNVLLATGCGLLIYLWAYELAGPPAALVCVSLWYLDPNIIAHSGLATVDIGASAFGILATYLFWRSLRYPGRWTTSVAGTALGCALAAKFSLLALCPAWLAAALIAQFGGRLRLLDACDLSQRKQFWNFVGILVVGLTTLNLAYLFQGSGTRLSSFAFVSGALTEHQPDGEVVLGSNKFRSSILGTLPIPLPKDYVLGLDSQIREEEYGFANLDDGHLTRNRPAPWYSPFLTLGVKLPEGTLLLVLLALLVRCVASQRYSLAEVILLTTTIAIFTLICIHTRINWLFRYSIPALPLMIVSCAPSLRSIIATNFGKIVISVAIILNIIEIGAARPFYLSHGNFLIGGREGAQRIFLGSNFDWGQDIIRLHQWHEINDPLTSLALSLYGPFDPHLFGIHSIGLPSSFYRNNSAKPGENEAMTQVPEQAESDFYWAISSNILHGFSGPMPKPNEVDPSIGVLTTRELTPDRAVAKIGSIYVFKVIPEGPAAGKSIYASDLTNCIKKAEFSDIYVTP